MKLEPLTIGAIVVAAYLLTKTTQAQARNTGAAAKQVQPMKAGSAPMRFNIQDGVSLLGALRGFGTSLGFGGSGGFGGNVGTSGTSTPGSFGNPFGFGTGGGAFPWLSGDAPASISEDAGPIFGSVAFGGAPAMFSSDDLTMGASFGDGGVPLLQW
jgi:hypothetical protein